MKRTRLRLLVGLFVASGCVSGCVSDRYVGSIGRDRTYSNRGYGLAIGLATGSLESRWTVIDPSKLEDVDQDVRPRILDAPLDLDGNGELEMGETVRYHSPMLRLVSRAQPKAEIRLDAMILGGSEASLPLDLELVDMLLGRMRLTAPTRAASMPSSIGTSTVSAPGSQERSRAVRMTLRDRRTAWVAEVEEGGGAGGEFHHCVALIDQGLFTGEEHLARRQVIRVWLRSTMMNDDLRSDLDRVVGALILNRRGSAETVREHW